MEEIDKMNEKTESVNYMNDFSITELNYIREIIENMSKFNQIEVLRIFHKYHQVTLCENKYGIHINLTELDTIVIEELKSFINYVNTQEIALYQLEEKKEKFKNIYFTKDNKDIKNNNSKNISKNVPSEITSYK